MTATAVPNTNIAGMNYKEQYECEWDAMILTDFMHQHYEIFVKHLASWPIQAETSS